MCTCRRKKTNEVRDTKKSRAWWVMNGPKNECFSVHNFMYFDSCDDKTSSSFAFDLNANNVREKKILWLGIARLFRWKTADSLQTEVKQYDMIPNLIRLSN